MLAENACTVAEKHSLDDHAGCLPVHNAVCAMEKQKQRGNRANCDENVRPTAVAPPEPTCSFAYRPIVSDNEQKRSDVGSGGYANERTENKWVSWKSNGSKGKQRM